GKHLFDPSAPHGGWHAGDALADPAYADVVALAIDNGPDRIDAYTHVTDHIDASGAAVGGQADAYLASVDDVVLPFFRARYGVVAHGGSLVVAGSSLGGVVSLYAAVARAPRQGGVTPTGA